MSFYDNAMTLTDHGIIILISIVKVYAIIALL